MLKISSPKEEASDDLEQDGVVGDVGEDVEAGGGIKSSRARAASAAMDDEQQGEGDGRTDDTAAFLPSPQSNRSDKLY